MANVQGSLVSQNRQLASELVGRDGGREGGSEGGSEGECEGGREGRWFTNACIYIATEEHSSFLRTLKL